MDSWIHTKYGFIRNAAKGLFYKFIKLTSLVLVTVTKCTVLATFVSWPSPCLPERSLQPFEMCTVYRTPGCHDLDSTIFEYTT